MNLARRTLLAAALAGALPARAAPPADVLALRLTVAYPPGGVSDETARELARRLEPRLGGTVLVDHRPGAGGAIALEAVSRGAPDGRWLCFCATTPLLRPAEGALRPDTLRDIAPVAAVVHVPVLVVATPAFAGATLAALVEAARAAPGRVRWASSGQGTTGHAVLEAVAAAAGAEIAHIPYSGGGAQINDALAGQFEVLSTNVAARQVALLREGRLRALAVGSPQRVALLPEVPTLAELGFPAANLGSLFGLFAPGRTPAPRLQALNRAVNAVLDEPGFRERLHAGGQLPAGGTREDFAARIAAEAAARRGAAARR